MAMAVDGTYGIIAIAKVEQASIALCPGLVRRRPTGSAVRMIVQINDRKRPSIRWAKIYRYKPGFPR
jgi:hypothetical protein